MPPLPINASDKLGMERSTASKPQKASRLKLLAAIAVMAFVAFHGLSGSSSIRQHLSAGGTGRRDCGSLEALDERARCVLANTPLIGKYFPVSKV